MRYLWAFLAGVGLIGLGLTHMGRWAPIGDAVAVLRPHVLVLSLPVIIGLWLSGQRATMWAVVLAVGLSGFSTWRDFRGAWDGTAPDDYTLYQKNLLWNAASPELMLADIRSASPDIVTLQEVSGANQPILDGLVESHPHRLFCQTLGNGGIAILSRFPFEPSTLSCTSGNGMILARVVLPGARLIWVAAIHLNWPYPFDQARQLPRIVESLGMLEGEIVIGGDFNMVPWGSAVRQITQAARGERVGGYGTTYPGFGALAPLAIDHVIVPRGARGWVDVRPRLGSDHMGLLLSFSLPAR